MCLFCKIVNREIPSKKIYENDYVYAFLDIFPMSKGHTLVVPKNHSTSMLNASSNDILHCIDAVKYISAHYEKSLNATGFNIVSNINESSGQTVFHTHFHIIPRYNENKDLFKSFKEDSEVDLDRLQNQIKL